MTAWIHMVPPEEAEGELKELYDRVTTPHGSVDNVMRVHSLRPPSLAGHIALYKGVLHNPENKLPFWFLETVAVYTSIVNNCAYSFAHHFANVTNLLKDPARSDAIRAALEAGAPERVFDGKELALLRYTAKLTADVGAMEEADVAALKDAGCDDGEILEANQVCAYFNYSNRLLNGLGVSTQGDNIGYYKAET